MSGLVDGHFHIWDLQKFKYDWPTENESSIFRNFTIGEYDQQRDATPVKYGVFIQVLQHSPEEADWLLEQAKEHPAIKGIVAGVDLSVSNVEEILDRLQKNPLFVGVRHILDFEPEDWITRDDVHRGLGALEARGLTYDLLVRPPHLKHIPGVVSKFPKLKFVINHIAKPYVKEKKIDEWKKDIAEIAKYTNVHCKISGIVTEGDLHNIQVDVFKPYVEHILMVFGVDRCFFGSDWPVCFLAGYSFKDVYDLAGRLLGHLSEEDKTKFFASNCAQFYNLKIP